MNITIRSANMTYTEQSGYVGKVAFEVENHKQPYEITLHSVDQKEWGYSLHYLHESGPDDEIEAVDEYLDENDEALNRLVQAAKAAFQAPSQS